MIHTLTSAGLHIRNQLPGKPVDQGMRSSHSPRASILELTTATEIPPNFLWHRKPACHSNTCEILHYTHRDARLDPLQDRLGSDRRAIQYDNRDRFAQAAKGQHSSAEGHGKLPREAACYGSASERTEDKESGRHPTDNTALDNELTQIRS